MGGEFISRHILHQHRFNGPIALPVREKPQHRRLLTVISATSASSATVVEFLDQPVNSFA
jgi:hypothetical protein